MAEHYYRAIEVGAGGFIHETGDAVIVAPLDDLDELQFAFPADDIPKLMLLLSRIHAQNISGRDVEGALALPTSVDSAQFLVGRAGESILLIADLEAGTPISLSIPHSVALALHIQLSEALGK